MSSLSLQLLIIDFNLCSGFMHTKIPDIHLVTKKKPVFLSIHAVQTPHLFQFQFKITSEIQRIILLYKTCSISAM